MYGTVLMLPTMEWERGPPALTLNSGRRGRPSPLQVGDVYNMRHAVALSSTVGCDRNILRARAITHQFAQQEVGLECWSLSGSMPASQQSTRFSKWRGFRWLPLLQTNQSRQQRRFLHDVLGTLDFE
jgi:hypothetical protein